MRSTSARLLFPLVAFTLLVTGCGDPSRIASPLGFEVPEPSFQKGGAGNASSQAPVFFTELLTDGSSPLLARFRHDALAADGTVSRCVLVPSDETGRGNFRKEFAGAEFQVSVNQERASIAVITGGTPVYNADGLVVNAIFTSHNPTFVGEARWTANLSYEYVDADVRTTANFLSGKSQAKADRLVGDNAAAAGRSLTNAWCSLTRNAAGFYSTNWITFSE